MLHTQKFLDHQKSLGNDPFAELTKETGIKCRHYPEGFVLLDYDQIESPKSDPRVIECRSLIMCANTFGVIARKFNRFFNAGECPDYYTDFVAKDSSVFLKEDGSIIGVYWNMYTEKWEISTRGMALAEGQHQSGKSFREMVIDAFGLLSEDEFQNKMQEVTRTFASKPYFTFEWVSPLNKIVTPYEKSEMVLLGVGVDGMECTSVLVTMKFWVDYMSSFGMNVRLPRMFDDVEDLHAAMESANALTGMLEGFVLYHQPSGKRVKVKSSTYVTAHRLRGNDPVPTRKNMLELVLTGEVDEFLAYFPEWKEMLEGLQAEVSEFLAGTEMVYNRHSGIESQKDFALAVKDYDGAAYMFSARKLNKSVTEIFNAAPLQQKMKTFGV